MIREIDIDGYRVFSRFHADLASLTVIIGANATGKSSLFDLIRFLSFAATNPLPPEIDPRSLGRTLFHTGGQERLELGLTVDAGLPVPLRFEVEIQGPVGSPTVVRERLATLEPLHGEPLVFLDFHAGKGVVRDSSESSPTRPEWTVQPNELALRRALDPTLATAAKFQALLSGCRFYSGFDIANTSAIRTEQEPILTEDGSNLSAVLFHLMTKHPDIWQELEVHLGSAVPGFHSINVNARGAPGTVIGVWNEEGASGLRLGDLSDGTIRLLCWFVLCLSPTIPPLICIDQPEIGLHPRVLPTLAGLLRLASTRTQVLIATQSPYLLSQFNLGEIAVMRKENGRAEFLRPSDQKALRRELEELGPEALVGMHVSDELEVRCSAV